MQVLNMYEVFVLTMIEGEHVKERLIMHLFSHRPLALSLAYTTTSQLKERNLLAVLEHSVERRQQISKHSNQLIGDNNKQYAIITTNNR